MTGSTALIQISTQQTGPICWGVENFNPMKTFTSVLFLRENSGAVTVNMSPAESCDHQRVGQLRRTFQVMRTMIQQEATEWYCSSYSDHSDSDGGQVNVPNINARNTTDFIGLGYFLYTENQLIAHDEWWWSIYSTSFLVTSPLSYEKHLCCMAVYFRHLKWKYSNYGIPQLTHTNTHTHAHTLLHPYTHTYG